MKSIDANATRLQLLRGVAATEQASTSSSGAEKWKRSSLLESNARPVAIEPKVDEILRLLDDAAAHPVIAVVRMGGVGKTFLLQNVYNDPRTKMMFDKCIWLSISQTYILQKLQSDIAFSLGLGDVVVAGHLSEQTAAVQIHESLNGKKFLIVLDDVWRATEEDNLIERLGIPHANTHCKIVVTTRSMDVCTRMNASSIYHMEVLNKEDSWDLFCLYAFYPDNRPPPHLKEIARQIERECGKLPLALKTVGALASSMANRERTGQWEFMLKKLKAVRKPDPIMEILQLSYDFLPAHIKPCFLYLAFFGEDEGIDVEYLIDLWRAEGFVPEGDDWREIGLDWYYQLCNLCLLERKENKWLIEYYKIHDLVRDLAIYICRENKCAFTLEEGCTKYSSSCTQYLSEPDKSSGCCRMFLANQHIKEDQISDRISGWICEFINLTVLVLENCHCSEYPAVESLPNLITLYLWGNRKCREVRKSFGKCGAFPNLRFLHIDSFPMLEEFPVLEGGSMPCLEEFRFTFCVRVGRVKGLEQLKSLKVFDFRDSGTVKCRKRLKEEGWKKIKANNPRVRISIGRSPNTS